MAYGLHHAIGIFFHCSVFVTKQMNAGYANVQALHQRLIGIEGSLSVENVDFGTQHQFDAIHLPRHHMEVSEINGVASAGDARRMLRDAEQLQAFLSPCLRHFLNGAERMTTGQRMGVHIEFYVHIYIIEDLHHNTLSRSGTARLLQWLVERPSDSRAPSPSRRFAPLSLSSS